MRLSQPSKTEPQFRLENNDDGDDRYGEEFRQEPIRDSSEFLGQEKRDDKDEGAFQT
jgi:hypothetical protein